MQNQKIRRTGLWLALICGAWFTSTTAAHAQSDFPADHEPILYGSAEVNDPVSRLQRKVESGEVKLEFDSKHGYLAAVLEALEVPSSSQGLVFSKTSFQRDRIAPETPRALYFNDDVYVGWVRWGEVMELSAVDPQKGAIFYTLSQDKTDVPVFRRHTHECLQCHESGMTQGVPGHIVRSVYSDSRGQPVLSAGTFVTNHNSPFKERWGGWFVTGTHGKALHMGNQWVARNSERRLPQNFDYALGSNRSSLEGLCEIAPYLTPDSDIVALMVLEHQTHVQNLITRANYQARLALRDEESINRALGRDASERLESTMRRVKSVGEPLVAYLLFADEPAFEAPVAGTSRFSDEFARRGPRDRQGRSLRDFDLQQRLFRHPLSYQIYSDAFDALPAIVRDYVYTRIWEILSGNDQSGKFKRLTEEDRKTLVEIVRETKDNLPDCWKP